MKEYFIGNPQINAEDAIKYPTEVSEARQTSQKSVYKEIICL